MGQAKTHKQLKEEYKRTTFPMGVFQIRNKTNGRVLVGSSLNLAAIWNRHRAQLKFGGHPNKQLQGDWNEQGEQSFVFEVLDEIERKDEARDYSGELKALEELYLAEIEPFSERGYNKKPVPR